MAMSGTTKRRSTTTNRPSESAFKQQKLAAWQPMLTPGRLVGVLLILGAGCIVAGACLLGEKTVQAKVQYDGRGTDGRYDGCKVTEFGQRRWCEVSIKTPARMEAPVHVSYELSGMHQNHRRYSNSLNHKQLMGQKMERSELGSCAPLKVTDAGTLNPCGLQANSLFDDVFTPIGFDMKERDISPAAERRAKFAQPDDFDYARVDAVDQGDVAGCLLSSCGETLCSKYGLGAQCRGYACVGGDFDGGKCHAGEYALFEYPSEESFQYLYETFPAVVSPLVGVENEHFIVWMQTASLPHFRKLYGRITHHIPAHTVLTFNVSAAFYARRFDGRKWLVVGSTDSPFGTNPFLGIAYIVLGVASVSLALFFAALQRFRPRRLGDPSQAHVALRKHFYGSGRHLAALQACCWGDDC